MLILLPNRNECGGGTHTFPMYMCDPYLLRVHLKKNAAIVFLVSKNNVFLTLGSFSNRVHHLNNNFNLIYYLYN